MPTASERLYQVTAKLFRAKKHFCDLEQMHKEYVDSHPIKVKETNSCFYVERIKEPGADFVTTTGDILRI